MDFKTIEEAKAKIIELENEKAELLKSKDIQSDLLKEKDSRIEKLGKINQTYYEKLTSSYRKDNDEEDDKEDKFMTDDELVAKLMKKE